MEAILRNNLEKSKLTLIKGDAIIKRANLDSFRRGWNCLLPLEQGENFIVYKAKNYKDVAFWVKAAQERIDEKKLPLTVIGTGEVSNTFIVKA